MKTKFKPHYVFFPGPGIPRWTCICGRVHAFSPIDIRFAYAYAVVTR